GAVLGEGKSVDADEVFARGEYRQRAGTGGERENAAARGIACISSTVSGNRDVVAGSRAVARKRVARRKARGREVESLDPRFRVRRRRPAEWRIVANPQQATPVVRQHPEERSQP